MCNQNKKEPTIEKEKKEKKENGRTNLKIVVERVCIYRYTLILNPDPQCSVMLKPSRNNHILYRMTRYGDNNVSVTLELLQHVFTLKIPNAYTFVFWSTNYVLPSCDWESRCHAIHSVHMSCVDLQRFPWCIVPQPLDLRKFHKIK